MLGLQPLFFFFFFKGIHFPGSRDRTLVVVFTDPVLGKSYKDPNKCFVTNCNRNSA